MKTNDATRASAEVVPETRDVGDAIDLLCKAISINNLIFEAAHRMSDRVVRNAFVEGVGVVDDTLNEVKAILYASFEQQGGAS